jgi:alkylation response protein AidB-like acyl-CoA dehydrogenase
MAATAFAMQAVSDLASTLADRGDRDIRLEAAVAKMWNSEEGWRLVDRTFQLRGGRGYETADSLRARGEAPIPVERMMRDFRINLVFEGSSEIMRLFIAREALDRHLAVAGALVNPEATLATKLAALPRIAAFYGAWYPARWLGWGRWPRFAAWGPLATHLRFAERASRKLGRTIFHLMVAHGPKLEQRQALLFRTVDVGADLFALLATASRAHQLRAANDARASEATELADLFCRRMRRRIADSFRAVRRNDDVQAHGVADRLLDGRYRFLAEGLLPAAYASAPSGAAGRKPARPSHRRRSAA